MIAPELFVAELQSRGTGFFTGVPDSLLKNLCAYITDTFDEKHHIIAANEGNAVALAVGHHLATGTIPMVYMQNSGEGNAVNPLLSLADGDVYRIPLLLCIGWRGEPGVHDEPQHVKQGKVTLSLLDTMGIPFQILSSEPDEMKTQVEKAYAHMRSEGTPMPSSSKKDYSTIYALKNARDVEGTMTERKPWSLWPSILRTMPYVSTTGMASRELYEIRERNGEGHQKDFLTVGSMGHASQIALCIALSKKTRQFFCLYGDGAALMHLGGMAIIGTTKPENYVHIILNNGAHDSVGGQPTVGRDVDLASVALCLGYKASVKANTQKQLIDALKADGPGPRCIEVLVRKGNRKDLGRPKSTPVENKQAFMQYIAEANK